MGLVGTICKNMKNLLLIFILLFSFDMSGQNILRPNQSGDINIISHSYMTVSPDKYGNMINRSPVKKTETRITINESYVTVKRSDKSYKYKVISISQTGNNNPTLRCMDTSTNEYCYINVKSVFGLDNTGDVSISYDNSIYLHYFFFYQ